MANPKEKGKNKREFSRAVTGNVGMGASIVMTSRRRAALHDVSLNGMFLRLDPAAFETECAVTVYLGEPGSGVEIKVQGKVVRQDDADGVAILITEVLGVDSLEHLRNLIAFNAADADRVTEEFQSHLGLKRKPRTSKKVSAAGKARAVAPRRGRARLSLV